MWSLARTWKIPILKKRIKGMKNKKEIENNLWKKPKLIGSERKVNSNKKKY